MHEEPSISLWIGEKDELVHTTKVAGYTFESVTLESATRLGIFTHAHEALGPWILQHL